MSAADSGGAGYHHLVVDRREGNLVAVEVDGGATVDLPIWLLPPGVREGDVIRATVAAEGGAWRVSFVVDVEATRTARGAVEERLERLRARDPGGDIEL